MTTEPQTIYEDENFLAINKPTGMQVHAAKLKVKSEKLKVFEPTLIDWLLKNYPEVKDVGDDPATRPGIVHRLDKETSGVMLIARNQKTFEYLKSLFQAGQIRKTYLALVFGKTPGDGIIEKPIGIRNGTLKRSVHSEKMAKSAFTEYRLIKHVTCSTEHKAHNIKHEAHSAQQKMLHTPCSMLYVYPKTGRTHQIRVHLASIGHPVVGDRLYGGKSYKSLVMSHKLAARLMLHALAIEFTKQDGGRVRFEADPPEEFTAFFN
jgi:23S rRNA pseudouridine1911/1915/1917 synthase